MPRFVTWLIFKIPCKLLLPSLSLRDASFHSPLLQCPLLYISRTKTHEHHPQD
uniref:Uncharacterized protein n=1 Tax=Triticum urartu TaxID=4572 RepID=A0A8R7PMK9_TRIUA